jgi:hypothetical protein
MSKEQIEFGMEFISRLATRNARPVVIGLTGGEPTIHPLFWSFVMPQIAIIRKQYPELFIELHTNGSQPVDKREIFNFNKFFSNVVIGHDIFHRQFRALKDLFLEDYAELSYGVAIKSNSWLITRPTYTAVCAPLIRSKGRGANLNKHPSYQQECVDGYPKHMCSLYANPPDGLIVNFTPTLINHCGEKSRPLADNSDITDFSNYTDDVDTILANAHRYHLARSNKNCSQKCMCSFVTKKNNADDPTP